MMIVSQALTRQFKGFNIRVRLSDGYIHAIDMCNVGVKKWTQYIKNKSTKEFLDELAEEMKTAVNTLIESNTAGPPEDRGTWVHPHIAINLSQWISPIFAVKVAGWVSRFLYGDLTLAVDLVKNHDTLNNTATHLEIAANPENNAHVVAVATSRDYSPENADLVDRAKYNILKDNYDDVVKQNEKLSISNNTFIGVLREIKIIALKDKDIDVKEKGDLMKKIDALLDIVIETKEKLDVVTNKLDVAEEDRLQLEEKLDTITDTLNIVLPDRVLTKNLKKERLEFITILEDTNTELGGFNLYIMKRKDETIDIAIKQLKKKYGDGLSIAKKIQQPNARALWDMVKEKHKYHIVEADGGWFRLISISKEDFYLSIDALDFERKNA